MNAPIWTGGRWSHGPLVTPVHEPHFCHDEDCAQCARAISDLEDARDYPDPGRGAELDDRAERDARW